MSHIHTSNSNYDMETVNSLDYILDMKDTGELEEDSVVCPYCKGSGLDRKLDADCLTCWGEGSILV